MERALRGADDTTMRLLLITIFAVTLNAFAIVLSWNWLLVPIVGAHMMTLHVAFAVSFVGRMVTSMHFYDARKEPISNVLITATLTPLICIVIAYIWSLFL